MLHDLHLSYYTSSKLSPCTKQIAEKHNRRQYPVSCAGMHHHRECNFSIDSNSSIRSQTTRPFQNRRTPSSIVSCKLVHEAIVRLFSIGYTVDMVIWNVDSMIIISSLPMIRHCGPAILLLYDQLIYREWHYWSTRSKSFVISQRIVAEKCWKLFSALARVDFLWCTLPQL